MREPYVTMLEFRVVREHDLFEVGCETCGNCDYTTKRRWPRDDVVEYILNRVCTCEEK